jgi:hypothetical protein
MHVGGEELRRHHYSPFATLTPGLRSLGLGVTRRVAVPIDDECLGLIDHEWKEDRLSCCGSASNTVNADNYL